MILLAVLLPIAAGILILPLKIKNRNLKLTAMMLVLGVTTALCVMLALGGDVTFHIWQMTENLSLDLRVDDLARLFIILVSAGWFLTGLFACVYMKHEQNEDRFFAFMLISEGAMLMVALSENLTTLYTAYEVLTLVSMPLVLHSLSKEAILAALKYLFYSIAGAFLALLGMFFLYKYTSTLSFVPGGTLDMAAALENQKVLLPVIFVTVIGFATKAGMYPMHGWLPTAHPVAPAPASALLSGLIAKAGVIAVIRVIYYMVGTEYLKGTWVQTALIILALVTIFMGSMMAFLEKVLKKRLAYSTVSQISYILVGVFMLSSAGVQGALLHVVFHVLSKVCLFLTAGAVIFLTGKTRVDQLTGIGKQIPITIWCFTLAALTLIGIPPTGGFTSKWYLASAALSGMTGVFQWLIPVVLLISALLTAGYLLPITVGGFFPGKDEVPPARIREPVLMWLPMLVLGVLAVALGLFSGGLVDFTGSVASLLG